MFNRLNAHMQETFGGEEKTPEVNGNDKMQDDGRSDLLTHSEAGTTAGEDGKDDPLG